MKLFIFHWIFSLTAIIAMGVMGVEIFEGGMRNITLMQVCAWITMTCLIGILIVALIRLYKEKMKP